MKINQRKGSTRVDLSLGEWSPEQILRLNRLARELRLMDQILTDDMDTLSILEGGPAPAWTTLEGDHVSFDVTKMPQPKGRFEVAVWLGTNAHEIGHVLFSPRRNSTLMKRVMAGATMLMPRLAELHNIVEDQRQERLILAKFSPWSAYLTAALGFHIKADNDTAWLLLCGRTWLPTEIRYDARHRFVVRHSGSSQVADEVSRLVGEYQRLTDPGELEADDAWQILMDLYDVLDIDIPIVRVCGVMDDSAGSPDTGEPDEGSIPAAADDPEADVTYIPIPADEGEGDEGEADGEDEGIGSGKGEQQGGAGGHGAGNAPGGKAEPPTIKEIEKALREILKDAAQGQIAENEEARGDLDSILDAIEHGRDGGNVDGAMPIGRIIEATDSARRLHHEVGDALLDLKDMSEPGWVKRVDSGRLNVRRLADPHVDADTLFDRYEPGQMDASELEVALLVDVSGSMQGHVAQLAEATWAIRQAVDDLDGRMSVMAYESGQHQIWAEPGVRPDDRMFVPKALGGTEPLSALREAWEQLIDSSARNRLLIILTDGAWYTTQGDRLVESMNQSGVVTVMALLGRWAGEVEQLTDKQLHGCRFGAYIDNPAELARLFRHTAEARIGEWL